MKKKTSLEYAVNQMAHLLVSATLRLARAKDGDRNNQYAYGQRWAAKYIMQSVPQTPANKKIIAGAIRNWLEYYRKYAL